jgi:hypothetical protein
MNYENEVMISAAMDGESIDLDLLGVALASDEGREMLASFVLLRAKVASDNIFEPLPLFVAASHMSRHRRLDKTSLRPVHGAGRPLRIAAAVALATLAMACTFWLGGIWRISRMSDQGTKMAVSASAEPPQKPGSPASVLPNSRSTRRLPAATEEPPKPTRTLRFVPGMEWHTGF